MSPFPRVDGRSRPGVYRPGLLLARSMACIRVVRPGAAGGRGRVAVCGLVGDSQVSDLVV